MKQHYFTPVGDSPYCAFVKGVSDDAVCGETERSLVHIGYFAGHLTTCACVREGEGGYWIGNPALCDCQTHYFSEYMDACHKLDLANANRAALEAGLKAYQQFALEAFKMIDADKEMKAMKLLLAMAGESPGYRHDVDQAAAALALANGQVTASASALAEDVPDHSPASSLEDRIADKVLAVEMSKHVSPSLGAETELDAVCKELALAAEFALTTPGMIKGRDLLRTRLDAYNQLKGRHEAV